MAFAGINDQLCRNTKRLQGVPEFVGLRRRTFRIALTDYHQGGGLHILNEVNRRTLLVNGGIVVNRCAEERNHPLIDQVLAIVTLPVGNAGTGDSAAETVSLADSPHGHKAAVTPAGHAETRRIDWILAHRSMDPGKHFALIAAARVVQVSA